MRIQGLKVAALVTAVAAAPFAGSARAAVVFSDNLTSSSSTVGGTSTPSGGTTTSYDIASAKNSSAAAITSSGLSLPEPATTSAVGEAQAIFTSSPITLATVGDSIELTVTFTDKTGGPVAAYFGLYNSGGVAPKTDLANSGLSSASTTDATGGALGYTGYVANFQNNTTTTSKIQTRPVQSGTTNVVQDLVSAGASSSQSYAGATQLGSATAPTSVLIIAGGTYTEDLLITVTAAQSGSTPIQYSIGSNLYSGSSATGTPIYTVTGTDPNTTPAAFGYNGFDALAVGYRETVNAATELDYTSIKVTANVAGTGTPEPASLGLLAIGGLALISRRRNA